MPKDFKPDVAQASQNHFYQLPDKLYSDSNNNDYEEVFNMYFILV